MRISVLSALVFLALTVAVYAATREANVNVILEIEGEYKFEPFKEQSEGLGGFVKNGFMRIIRESDPNLPKYEALNQAMQKARNEVFQTLFDTKIGSKTTVKSAVLSSPPYTEIKDKHKMEGMTQEQKAAYIKRFGKEKKYDIENLYGIIRECGSYKNSGRHYDAVEKKGYACIEVHAADYFRALDNDRINIFANLNTGEKYRPVDGVRNYVYDAVIIDTTELDGYTPQLFTKILSPTEETVYAGIAGRRNIYFVSDIEEAKVLLAGKNVKKAYNAYAQGVAAAGVIVTLQASDRIFSLIAKNRELPVVIIYKEKKA